MRRPQANSGPLQVSDNNPLVTQTQTRARHWPFRLVLLGAARLIDGRYRPTALIAGLPLISLALRAERTKHGTKFSASTRAGRASERTSERTNEQQVRLRVMNKKRWLVVVAAVHCWLLALRSLRSRVRAG